jgi:RNA polymerase sigma factor (sigma-70 family)
LNQQTRYTEQELVYLLQQQDSRSFSYLYDNYGGSLYSVIQSVVTEEETASDVLQEVFVNIWQKIGSYDPTKGRLFTWMLNVARNAAIDKVRSKGFRNSRQNVSLPEQDGVQIGGAVAQPDPDNKGLRKMVNGLKEDQRVLVELSYFQGFTHEEIAKKLGIPLGTVKTRIRTALTQLRTLLQ